MQRRLNPDLNLKLTPIRLKTELIADPPNSPVSAYSEDVSTDSDKQDVYLKQFGQFKVKNIGLGPDCQVDPDNVPLITDIIEDPLIHFNSAKYHDVSIQ